jgi:hypothetical protein
VPRAFTLAMVVIAVRDGLRVQTPFLLERPATAAEATRATFFCEA